MVTLIKIAGIVILSMGLAYTLRPEFFKALLEFFKKGYSLYAIGVLRFILAAVFLFGAPKCSNSNMITILGVLFIISGLLIFALGLVRLKKIIQWYLAQPLITLRAIGIITLAVGALIIYSA
ncbi:MAG: hypothetical protein H8D47_00340 [Planctomycetes bacterium]|nr:hypothetical protein [Planctomycetota bacterium]